VIGHSENSDNPEWNLIKTSGTNQPKPIANHTSVVFDNKMYLYGGGGGMCENREIYTLDLDHYTWSQLR